VPSTTQAKNCGVFYIIRWAWEPGYIHPCSHAWEQYKYTQPPFLLNSPSPTTPNLQETRVGLKFKRPLQQRAIVNPVLQSEELGWDFSFTKVSEPKCAHKNLVYITTHCEPKDRYFYHLF
jgi:hypothetical protein